MMLKSNEKVFECIAQYVRDFSVESLGPLKISADDKREMNFEIQQRSAPDNTNKTHIVDLLLRLVVRHAQRPLLQIEITYTGVFKATNIPEALLESLLAVDAPALLYPFVRQVVMQAAEQAGQPLPPLQLVNFAQLYAQKMQDNTAVVQ